MSSVTYYLIIGAFLATLCVHGILCFMFMVTFQFVFIFHIIFMFHEHIYCISYIFFLFHACCIWHFIYLYGMTPMCSHLIHVFLFLYESILLRNWNHSNWIIQTKVMAFSCQTSQFTDFTLGTVCNTQFSGDLTSYLTLVLCIHLKLRC